MIVRIQLVNIHVAAEGSLFGQCMLIFVFTLCTVASKKNCIFMYSIIVTVYLYHCVIPEVTGLLCFLDGPRS